ncbi:unnamed protein product [Bursaphelenchus okinawaensis]|uniref:CHHC U11-48K-type domain-containing protein n=1 Tax=Bursaphelenchus okinawaensis TaxID=465554 RepID=A0A811K3B2_9BILA|nr:unnamed protein product [Bursaphelenchus okinawaensis]CAG9090812.1 unnamed protein product [Bursaphelenchus okinawaensis]
MSENATTTAQCPYGSHNVSTNMLYLHVAQCRRKFLKRHPNIEFMHCPYNPSHLIPVSEQNFHDEHCNTKKIIQKRVENQPKLLEI